MLDFICDKWQNNTNCDSNRKEFRLRTTNKLNHIEKVPRGEDDCLLFWINQAEMIDQGKFNCYLV